MTRKASKILLYVSVSVLALLLAAVGFTQTTLFKQSLRSTLYKLVEANTNASVYIGEIRGNLFTGLSIDTLAMYVNNAPFIEARNVVVRYDPLPLWNDRIALGSVEIDKPSISLIRFSDSTWNVDRLSKKKSKPDSLPSPWIVTLSSLHISNGQFRLIDSTVHSTNDPADSAAHRAINFSSIYIRSLNIDLSATISEKEQHASIKNISFVSPREGFTLTKFSVDVQHTPLKTELSNLSLITPRSHIEFFAKIADVDAFKIKDISLLQNVPVECSISSSTIASEDVQRFLPSLNFLRGSVRVDGRIEGEFGNIQVKKLEAAFNHSTIVLAGSVANLHHPKELLLNVESKGTVISPSDVPALLPFFHIPDFGGAGNLALDFHFAGKPLDFQIAAHAWMPAGDISINGTLNLIDSVMKYQAAFGGKSVNIGRFFSKPSLRSHLDFSGTIDGRGTSIGELNSTVSIDVDSSSFQDISISRIRATATASNKLISLNAKVRSRRGEISLASTFDYAKTEIPLYSIKGNVSQFDLATIFNNDHYESECSFGFDARGSDFLGEHMTGDALMDFSPSRFGTHEFDGAHAELHLKFDLLGNRVVRFASPIADGSIDGKFTLAGVSDMINSHLGGLRLAYFKQRAVFDSTFDAASVDTSASENSGIAHLSLKNDINYSLHLKNLEPAAIFLGTDLFNAVGNVEGSLHGNADSLSAEGSLSIRSGKYTLKNKLLVVENGSVTYNFRDMTHDSLLAAVNGPTLTLHVNAAGVFVGDSYFRNGEVDFMFHNRRAEYSVQGEIDSTIQLGFDGRAAISPLLYQFTFDNFSVRYQGYELNNANQFSAQLNSGGFSIDSTLFTHQDEQLMLGGVVSYRGEIGAFVRLQNFTLSNIHHFGKSLDFKSSALLFGGVVNAHASVKGTMEDPLIICEIEGEGVAYHGTEFGLVNAAVNYANKISVVDLKLSRTDQARDRYELLCTGSIPMNLAFVSIDHRFSVPGMDVTLKAKNFDFSIIDPFIAEVDEMKGTLEGSIHCTGSLESPLFEGGMEFQNGEFLFPMNSMKYHAAGKIELNGNKVSFTTLSIRNLYEDYSSGKMEIGGYIALNGFVPGEYHLSATGELMVLQKTSLNANQGVYGDVTASTGEDGLLFDGTYSSSRLSGTIYLKQASLTFPSTRQSTNLFTSRYVNEIVVDDTSKTAAETFQGPSLLSFFRPKTGIHVVKDSSFLDGLGYDLVIQTQGIVQVRMVFNSATDEELFADLNGKLTLSKEGGNVRLTGTINVSEKSNYKFYKQFDASGTLTFTGRPDNPQLDIKATYRGTHVKSEAGVAKIQEQAAPPTEKVVVTLAITGTRYDPKIKIGLSTIDDSGNEKERTGDVESDAISFLLTSTPGTPGKFRDDLTSNDKQGIANSLGGSIGGSLISGFANTLLSGMMIDFLRANNINAVSNVEIQYSGTSPDLRLSGVVGSAYWTFGGKVFSDINNANISLQWSLGSIIQSERLRNVMFEVNRKTDALETSDLRRPTSGARIYYKFVF